MVNSCESRVLNSVHVFLYHLLIRALGFTFRAEQIELFFEVGTSVIQSLVPVLQR